LNCQSVIREISNYLDGELEAAIREEIGRHLRDCPECTLVVTQTKYTVEIFSYSEPVALPPDVRSRLHEALRRNIRKPGQ
jgi:anti-sigma factor RsiW